MPSLIRVSALLILLVAANACQSRHSAPPAPQPFSELPRRSVLVRKGGERLPIEEGRVTADSVIGLRRTGERFAVPLDSVLSVERNGGSALGGLAITVLWVGAALVTIVAIGYSQTY